MTVSPYERVASWLIAMLILVGTAVLVLFLLWLTSQLFASQAAVPVTLEQVGEGGGFGDSMELETEDLGQEVEFDEPEIQDTLATIADAVAAKTALLDTPLLSDQTATSHGGPKGDGRAPGFGSGKPGKPRHWEVRFLEGNTLETYARQLDFFGIELGVLLPGNKVEYASNLARPRPTRRTGNADEEKRYYLTWRRGGLRQADLELLGRAGIDAGDRLILKFLPPKLEAQLAQLERQRAGDRTVRTTYFAIRAQGAGYAFYVADQTYNYGRR